MTYSEQLTESVAPPEVFLIERQIREIEITSGENCGIDRVQYFKQLKSPEFPVYLSGMSTLYAGGVMANEGRRKFLGTCLAGAAVVAVAGAIYPVLRYLAPRSSQQGAEKVTFAVNDLPEGEAKFFQFAGSSAVVVKTKAGDVIALSAVCTHLGCIVQWEKDQQDFLCPCHAGRYASNGSVVAGPPPRPLAKLPVSVAEGKITVG
jgi:cytochrome b6-f complex iron-sulfur subunit